MGNCMFKVKEIVKVVTPNGGIMELLPPITAESITKEFPNLAIYRTPHNNILSHPLLHNENLHAGQLYYLLPTRNNINTNINTKINNNNTNHLISTSLSPSPYRMSFDQQRLFKRTDMAAAAMPTVWKVKLVISPDKLAEILSDEAPTEALIESVRTVAKWGSGVSSSVPNSDRWTVCSSLKGSLRSYVEDSY